jgi:REP-associated tyrosine transposase
LLGGVVRAKRWRCLAYCLMPNHVHLLIETPEANIARGMQYLHGFYAHHFNARYDLSGHLFQGRYGSKLIRDDVQFLAVVRYTALNPVEGGLCAMPEDWPWSSYGRALDGDAPAWLDVDGLLTHLGPPDPWAGYVQLVSGGRREPA